jgi:hypothetical protein
MLIGPSNQQARADSLLEAEATLPEASATAPKVSVVIPTLNEELNIAWVLERLQGFPPCPDGAEGESLGLWRTGPAELSATRDCDPRPREPRPLGRSNHDRHRDRCAIAGARHQPSRHLRFVMPVVHELLTQDDHVSGSRAGRSLAV